jgi:ATP-dependent Lon protease
VPPSGGAARDIAPALSALPLFPLPQTVLFPGALLPLHVFEPRYRTMVRDALDTHRALAVVLITDSKALDKHGHPAIARVAGAGLIVDHAELPGGRFNILVRGRARVELEELPFVPPYRLAAATILPSEAKEIASSDVSALLSAAAAFVAVVRERDKTFDFRFPKDAQGGALADLCAHHLVLDARERQTLLEMPDPEARVRRVTEALAVQRLTLAPDRGDVN